MSILDYFQEPNAERVLLVEIERNTTPAKRYYLADSYYVTEPTDTPANIIYSSIIGGRGLPEFRRTLNDPFTGNASTSFGVLELSDVLCSYKQGAIVDEETIVTPKGAKVFCFLAAPTSEFPRTDAVPLAVGTVQRFGGSSDGSYNIEITDNRESISTKFLEITEYPRCYGQVRNMTAVLGVPATRTYFVNQGEIESIDAVYDDGVLLAPAQYTVNLTNGSFSLVNNPVGRVTADVKGSKVSGVWLTSTQQVIEDILTRANVTGFPTDFNLPSGTIGYLITDTTSVQVLLDDLCRACGGYWLVDRLGTLKFRTYPTPSGFGEVFTERELLAEATYQTDETLIDSVKYTYRKNWTVFQPRVGAAPTQAAFVQKESESAEVILPVPDPELIYQDSPVLETYFDSQADAMNVANRLLNMYSEPRLEYNIVVPFMNTLDLGSTTSIMLPDMEATGVVTEVVDVFDGAYPAQRLKFLTSSIQQALLDLYQGASLAVSTRRLNNAYVGSVMRVRRSSDNAELDIGFSNNEMDVNQLTTFVGASDGFVVTWYDQSNSGNDLTQTNQLLQPRIIIGGVLQTNNGKPCVNFLDGSGSIEQHLLTSVFPYAASTPTLEYYSVYRLKTAASFPSIAGSTSDNGMVSLHSGTSRNPRLATVRAGITSTANATTPLVLNQVYQRSDSADRSTLFTRINQNQVLVTSDANTNFVQTGSFTLGNSGAGSRTDTNISEFVLYTNNQSANRTAIESNQITYFGVTP